mmetsp:Transcript_31674/g.51674  ORF Transcript_31674/g.51674 Transcript_31674/m.51674 type:complete len:357 (+) Transcript_31674:43-1113(+)
MFSLFSYVTPLNYLFFLTLSLLIFLGYLILPMGVRAQYCGAGRRRYRRQRRQKKLQQSKAPPQPESLPPEDILGNIYAYSHSFSPQEELAQLVGGTPSSSYVKSDFISPQTSALDSVWSGVDESQCSEISSAKMSNKQQQPSLPQILKEMLKQPPGIKFIAHGTKCRPRPVWITLHYDTNSQSTPPEYQNCLTWRAELKSSSSHKSSPVSPLSPGTRMGNLRKVELMEVLGIEMGKRTTALRRVQTAKGVDARDCFSLLTKTGTLDLECTGLVVAGSQSSAKEVRAAFITCLALAMSSKGLRLNGLQPLTSPSSLQSQLNGLNNASPASPPSTQWEERTLFSSLLSEARTVSTVSF